MCMCVYGVYVCVCVCVFVCVCVYSTFRRQRDMRHGATVRMQQPVPKMAQNAQCVPLRLQLGISVLHGSRPIYACVCEIMRMCVRAKESERERESEREWK